MLRYAPALAVLLAAPAPLAPEEVPNELRPALLRAERAIRAAACDVERRFGEGDPDANAASCEGAAGVPGVSVGRTSARLRNPRNAPPEWARAHVAATDGRKAAAVPPAVFDLGDRVGLLRPIEIRRRCLSCHAPAEELAQGTREWLRRAFPEDRALGYALGDLRGFWWAEAPKEPLLRGPRPRSPLIPLPPRASGERGSAPFPLVFSRPGPNACVRQRA